MAPRSSPFVSSRLDEFRLIRDLHRRFGRIGPAVLCGIGDDAAIIRPSPRHHLILTTDLLAEGVHFDLGTARFEDVGYKAGVANLSDIAAMGGIPRYVLVAIALPASRTPAEVEAFYQGLMDACRPHGVQLVGGDTSASLRNVFISLTMTGSVEPGRTLTRSGARVGDFVYVTGTLGDSLAGLMLLSTGRTPRRAGAAVRNRLLLQGDRYRRTLMLRHLRPTPRLREGRLLSTHRLATAAIDVSDGLSGDLAHVCEQSGVGAEIEAAALPLSPACRAYAATAGLDPVGIALKGGEDYELLFTVPPHKRSALERQARAAGCRFSRIGTIRPKQLGLRLREIDGVSRRLQVLSYRHFQGSRATQREAAWSH